MFALHLLQRPVNVRREDVKHVAFAGYFVVSVLLAHNYQFRVPGSKFKDVY
jgi:hypothetical protein